MANFHPIFLLVFVTTIVSPVHHSYLLFRQWCSPCDFGCNSSRALHCWQYLFGNAVSSQQQCHISSWLCLSIDTYLPTGMGLLWLHVAESIQPTGETKQLIFSGVLLVPAAPLYIESMDGWHGMSRKHWFLFSCTRVQCENVPNLQWQYEKVQIINCTVEDCEENEVAVVFFLYVAMGYILLLLQPPSCSPVAFCRWNRREMQWIVPILILVCAIQ